MALAATEKAKVCTSVRNRYLVVASTRPERRGLRGGGSPDPGLLFAGAATDGVTLAGVTPAGATTTGLATTGGIIAVGVGGVDTSFWLNPIRGPGFRRVPEAKF